MWEVILIDANTYQYERMDPQKIFEKRNSITFVRMFIWHGSSRYRLEKVSENKDRIWYRRCSVSAGTH